MINIAILVLAIFEGVLLLLFFLPWAILFQIHLQPQDYQECTHNIMLWVDFSLIFYWISAAWSVISIPFRYKALNDITDEEKSIVNDILTFILIVQTVIYVGIVVWLGIILNDADQCEPYRLLSQVYFIVNLVFLGIIALCCASIYICCDNVQTRFSRGPHQEVVNITNSVHGDPGRKNKNVPNHFEPIPHDTEESRPINEQMPGNNGYIPYFGELNLESPVIDYENDMDPRSRRYSVN